MRQVFSSHRIENVEAVARMLEDAGIEARITNGRSYRGAIRGNFSYREGSTSRPRPAVWVIRSDQQPEARRMLREAGLLQETSSRVQGFLDASPAGAGDGGQAAARGGNRFRYGVLIALAVMVALVLLAWRAGQRDEAPDTAAVTSATTGAVAASAAASGPGMPGIASLPEQRFTIATPPALAATLLREALATAGSTRGCLGIDGGDPGPDLLQELASAGLDVRPASACGDLRPAVSVGGYRTDGSGRGTVALAIDDGEAVDVAVRRDGRTWLRDEAP